jgi:dTDP-4-amino-4,6-dideoxygalactose transaminase
MNKIWLSSPHMDPNGLKYIEDAYNKNHVFPLGEYVDKFESIILNTIKNENAYCLALNSGTSAIHLALKLCNIKKGDEVICSTFTFSASANPILYEGGIPVFVDSEMDTWNMCPILLEKCINERIDLGKKPKAIILVHLYGMPAKIDDIQKISTKYDIPLIEDAAEALGSKYKNIDVGNFGKYSIFSFNGNKIITTSGGGALICKDKKSKLMAFKYATQSRESVIWYEHNQIGYNYRLSNISAAIGIGQIQVLKKRVDKRREIFHRYLNELSEIEGINMQIEPNSDYFSNHWLSTFVFNNGNDIFELINYLNKFNIESRPLWKPMHLQPFFRKYKCYKNGVSEKLFKTGVCLPSSSLLTYEDQSLIIKKIKQWSTI